MSATTQEDYFGNAVNDVEPEPRHHKSSRHKHRSSKPRSYEAEETDEEYLSPRELVREAKRTLKKSRHHETSSSYYDGSEPLPARSSSRRHRRSADDHHDVPEEHTEKENSDDLTSEDEERRRRRRRKQKRRERREREREREMEQSERSSIPDDVSSTVPEASSATDTEGDTASTASTSGRKRRRDRAKSIGEGAITALGLQETYQRARSRSRGRKESLPSDEGYDSTEGEGRARSQSRMQSNAAQAAIIAAAVEAFRARKEPGGPAGSKSLKRVVEAAVASGFAEKFLERKGEDDSKSNKRVAEAVLAGLAAQRGINGRRRRRDDGDELGNPVKELVASGLIGAAGKKFLDYQRSRSQSAGGRGRGMSEDGERPGLDRKRSRSVGEALAALGLGGLAANKFVKSRKERRHRGSIEDSGSDSDSSASSISDSDLSIDEEDAKKRHNMLRRKEIISVALAILATLHLGHTGYEAREKRANRKEKLESGRITEDESDKIRRKNLLGNAATVGLAVLAATEAVKSWKQMSKRRQEYHEFREKEARIEEHRHERAVRRALESGGGVGGTRVVPAGEANRYYQPGYMGAPPGGRDVPTYPYYPSTGKIPETYNRGGREIPVVYPSSVTHA